MLKQLFFGIVAATIVLTVTDAAYARRCRCCAPATVAATQQAPTTTEAVAQAPDAQTRRSYSVEPSNSTRTYSSAPSRRETPRWLLPKTDVRRFGT